MEVVSFHAWKIVEGWTSVYYEYNTKIVFPRIKKEKLEFDRTVADVAELYGRNWRKEARADSRNEISGESRWKFANWWNEKWKR
jgi:hypothetical protein